MGAVAAPLLLLARDPPASVRRARAHRARRGRARARARPRPARADPPLPGAPRGLARSEPSCVVALTVVFLRMPAAVPVALLAVAPVRIPVKLAGDEAFLLLPLYLVLAAAALALAIRLARGGGAQAAAAPRRRTDGGLRLARGAVAPLVERPPRRIDPPDLLPLPVHRPRRRRRTDRTLTETVLRALAVVLLVETALVAALGLWQEWRHGPFLDRRPRRDERLHVVLPRQRDLQGPEHLRPLSRARHRRSCSSSSGSADQAGRSGLALMAFLLHRPLLLVLPVELRRALRGRARGRRSRRRPGDPTAIAVTSAVVVLSSRAGSSQRTPRDESAKRSRAVGCHSS